MNMQWPQITMVVLLLMWGGQHLINVAKAHNGKRKWPTVLGASIGAAAFFAFEIWVLSKGGFFG